MHPGRSIRDYSHENEKSRPLEGNSNPSAAKRPPLQQPQPQPQQPPPPQHKAPSLPSSSQPPSSNRQRDTNNNPQGSPDISSFGSRSPSPFSPDMSLDMKLKSIMERRQFRKKKQEQMEPESDSDAYPSFEDSNPPDYSQDSSFFYSSYSPSQWDTSSPPQQSHHYHHHHHHQINSIAGISPGISRLPSRAAPQVKGNRPRGGEDPVPLQQHRWSPSSPPQSSPTRSRNTNPNSFGAASKGPRNRSPNPNYMEPMNEEWQQESVEDLDTDVDVNNQPLQDVNYNRERFYWLDKIPHLFNQTEQGLESLPDDLGTEMFNYGEWESKRALAYDALNTFDKNLLQMLQYEILGNKELSIFDQEFMKTVEWNFQWKHAKPHFLQVFEGSNSDFWLRFASSGSLRSSQGKYHAPANLPKKSMRYRLMGIITTRERGVIALRKPFMVGASSIEDLRNTMNQNVIQESIYQMEQGIAVYKNSRRSGTPNPRILSFAYETNNKPLIQWHKKSKKGKRHGKISLQDVREVSLWNISYDEAKQFRKNLEPTGWAVVGVDSEWQSVEFLMEAEQAKRCLVSIAYLCDTALANM